MQQGNCCGDNDGEGDGDGDYDCDYDGDYDVIRRWTIASGGGLWPEDDGEINNLTNNIGLWPQGEDDVPDVPSPADALHNSEGGMLVPYDAK